MPLIWKRQRFAKRRPQPRPQSTELCTRGASASGTVRASRRQRSPTCSFHCRQNLGSQSLKILQGTCDRYSRPWAPPSASRILHRGQKRRGSPDSPEMDTSKASHRNTPMGVKDARPCLKEDTAWARTGPEQGHRVSPLPPRRGPGSGDHGVGARPALWLTSLPPSIIAWRSGVNDSISSVFPGVKQGQQDACQGCVLSVAMLRAGLWRVTLALTCQAQSLLARSTFPSGAPGSLS